MLISHRYKFIFTKTVKTAGTSVEIYFEPYCMGHDEYSCSHSREQYESEHGVVGYRGKSEGQQKWSAHMSAEAIRDLLTPETWDTYFKFTVIRNPFDKMVSAWYHFVKPRLLLRQKIQVLLQAAANMRLLHQGKLDVALFRQWIREGGKIRDRDKYFINESQCIDFFIRYETLAEDMARVCTTLALPWQPERLGSFKQGRRDASIRWVEYYDQETQNIVADDYAWELEHFAYPLPSDL